MTMSTNHTTRVKSLAQLAEEQLIRGDLTHIVTGPRPSASYCCGGSLPVADTIDSAPYTRPVVVSWNGPDGLKAGRNRRIQFPIGEEPQKDLNVDRSKSRRVVRDNTSQQSEFRGINDLLRDCASSISANEGSSSLHKLDRSQFDVNFNPVEHQIARAVAQILLPEYGPKSTDRQEEPERTIFAELSGLNIYSGRGGRFYNNIDEDSSDPHFGYLIVRLPHVHEGGGLRLTQLDQWREKYSMRMGWSKDDPPSIQWLAFASDTECDIMDVMTGHLVVLVYTLYIRHNLGVTFQQSPRIDGSRYPLFDFAMPLIQCGAFMKQGGYLAFFCAHEYNYYKNVKLRGVDATVFGAFSALHLAVSVKLLRNVVNPQKLNNCFQDMGHCTLRDVAPSSSNQPSFRYEKVALITELQSGTYPRLVILVEVPRQTERNIKLLGA